MIFVKISFCLLYCSLSFQTGRGQSNTAKNTPDTSTSSKCHNVHFKNYYSGPTNKKIKVHLLKIENQLAELEKKIDALTENKTTQTRLRKLKRKFWLGLDKMHRLIKTKSRLRVELEDTRGKTAYAEYDMFSVSSERNKYRLRLGIYTGECFQSVDWSILARTVLKDTTKFERF